jgi:hypothetical protein
MKRASVVLCLLVLTGAVALAAPRQSVQPFPKTLINSRYVYVTSYDGDAFSPNILSEDRQAITDVRNAIHDWGRLIVVDRPQIADMILVVQKRGSEDTLAVYDARNWEHSTYLWRAMGRGGLDENEMPLFVQLKQAFEEASK